MTHGVAKEGEKENGFQGAKQWMKEMQANAHGILSSVYGNMCSMGIGVWTAHQCG